MYLIGAGPGDPGLLTLRAVECLSRADVVLHDKLVHRRILDFARPGSRRISVEELPGEHPARWPHILRLLLDEARQGRVVVRLKGGDPTIFGRGFEEAAALRDAGIPYEIVPGVTAALAASAYAEVPLTHRSVSSAVAIVTGHDDVHDAEQPLDWGVLARFPGTLVIYMGMKRLPHIVQTLIEKGMPSSTPAAVVRWASTSEQRTLTATLADLPQRTTEAGFGSPSVIVIGPSVRLRPAMAWFEKRPLLGLRVVVTRPRHQAEPMVRSLEELGASVACLPAVEIGDPPDVPAVDRALDRLADYQWLVFTSANGVDFFLRRMLDRGGDLRRLGQTRLAAIGPATAEALQRWHLRADVVPGRFDSEGLIEALAPNVAGQSVLLARADRGRDILQLELGRIARVDQVAVYSQRDAAELEPHVVDALRRGQIDWLTFTSSNIARSILGRLDEEASRPIRAGRTRIATISPITSEAVRQLGFPVAIEAQEATTAGLIAALVRETTSQSTKFAEGGEGQVSQDAAGQQSDDVDGQE
ncbi:MAG: uroporphyrinogen-III C-methyltransferase [Gemmataceae bacterium]|nr:uroporphyrinogen-III C-methyltransferase [Gemmataceae bacterium]